MHYVLFLLMALLFTSPTWAQNPNFMGTVFGQPGGNQPGGGQLQPSQSTQGKTTPPAGKATLPASTPPPESVGQISPEPQQPAATAANLKSQAFGAHLFTGAFARQGPTQFNPDYLVAIGDSIRLRLWGSATFDDVLMVDPQTLRRTLALVAPLPGWHSCRHWHGTLDGRPFLLCPASPGYGLRGLSPGRQWV